MAIDWLTISEELEQEVTKLGFEWIDFTHSSSMRSPWLRLYVDKRESSLSIDDATYLTRILVNWLEARLPETIEFRLDVSSPGLDRPFTKDWQFTKQLDKTLQVTVELDGKRSYPSGTLLSVNEQGISLIDTKVKKAEEQLFTWSQIIEAKVIFPVQEKNMKSKGTRR